MRRDVRRSVLVLLLPALAACASGGGSGGPERLTPAEVARRDGGIPPYTPADVRFMTGMIPHHAQAVLMAGWAESHGASPSIVALAERIVVAQRDEIGFMQRWLDARGEPVPSADPAHAMMDGMHHGMMPGMLTADELRQLDAARGEDWDRLFLTYMIRHHEGAISMVQELFGSPGAAQDDDVFRFASDVNVDQIIEIDRMSLMFEAMSEAQRR